MRRRAVAGSRSVITLDGTVHVDVLVRTNRRLREGGSPHHETFGDPLPETRGWQTTSAAMCRSGCLGPPHPPTPSVRRLQADYRIMVGGPSLTIVEGGT